MASKIFAMPSSSTFLLFSLALGFANGLPWSGPQKTGIYRPDAWSPAPTGIPDPGKLFKRTSVDVNICGWIGGNSAIPAICSGGSSCVHDTIHGYVGCCATEGPCTAGIYTSCIDKNSAGWSPNSGLENNGIFTCAGTQECYRNTYPGGYYQYGCGASSLATTVETTFAGQPSDVQLQIVYTGVEFTPTSAIPSVTTSGASLGSSQIISLTSSTLPATSSTTSLSTSSSSPSSSIPKTASSTSSGTNTRSSSGIAATSTPTPTPTPTPTHHKNNTGAIVGGVIGGLAFLALIAGLVFYLYRQKQRKLKQNRAGSFISSIPRGNQPQTSGPFQQLRPYGLDEFSPPLTANLFASNFAAATNASSGESGDLADQQPFLPVAAQNVPRMTEETPLVSNTQQGSEHGDFSRSYQNAVGSGNPFLDQPAPFQQTPLNPYSNIQAQTLTSSNPPDTATGLGLGIGVPFRGSSSYSSSTVSSSHSSHTATETNETRDPYSNFVLEPYNNVPLSPEESEPFRPRSESWVPQRLRTKRDPNREEGTWLRQSAENRDGVDGNGQAGSSSPSIDIPPKSPLRKSTRRGAGVQKARESGGSEVRRYQLVDQVLDDVPVLNSPGRLRMSRGERRS